MDAGTGSMTLIEKAFIPSFLLGTTDPTTTVGSTFSVSHTVQQELVSQMTFLADGTGTFIDSNSLEQDMTWSITLGILTVTESNDADSRLQWVFTAAIDPAVETNYLFTVSTRDSTYSAIGSGVLKRL